MDAKKSGSSGVCRCSLDGLHKAVDLLLHRSASRPKFLLSDSDGSDSPVQSSPVQFISVQGDIHALEEAHMHSTPFPRSFPKRCRRKRLKGSVPPSEVMYFTTVAH